MLLILTLMVGLDFPRAMGARLSLSANARCYVFVLLVVAISAGLLQLGWHCVFNAV
jgi:hypothetical protein